MKKLSRVLFHRLMILFAALGVVGFVPFVLFGWWYMSLFFVIAEYVVWLSPILKPCAFEDDKKTGSLDDEEIRR